MYTRIVFCLCAVLIALVATATAQDGVPQRIIYQGVLLDGLGNPVTTPVTIRWSYYADSTSLTPVFAETLLSTPDGQGRFCSSDGPFNSSVSNLEDAGFVGIGVGSDPEMTPRVRLGSAPFALLAQGVHGDIQTSPGSLSVGYTGPDSIKLTAASGKAAIDVISLGDSMIVAVGSGKTAMRMISDNAVNKDSCTFTAGSGKAAFAIGAHDSCRFTASSGSSANLTDTFEVTVGSGKATIKMVANNGVVGTPDSIRWAVGSGKAMVALTDSAGYHSELTSKSLVMSVNHFPVARDTLWLLDSDGNARFAGDVTFGWHGKDSLTYQNGILTFRDSAGYHSELTSQSLSYVLDNDTLGLIDNAGNARFAGDVGIGTSSPAAKLHVIGSSTDIPLRVVGGNQTFLERTGTGLTNLLSLYNPDQTDNNGVSLNFRGDEGATPSQLFAEIVAQYTSHSPRSTDFVFNARNSGEWREQLRIVSNGNVGIGTATPTSVLHVDGPIATAIATVTSSVTMLSTASVCLADNSFATGAITVTLPAANTCAGRQYTVKKISPLANGAVSVQRSGTDLIDGSSTWALNNQFDFYVLVSDGGSNWYIVGK